jgi:hypothetical protein
VPELEIIGPHAEYDPLRAEFNTRIAGWLDEVGIPTRSNLTGFNVIVDLLFSDTVADDLDMWILGWGLSLYPDYLENFFNSRHAPENEGGFNWGGYTNSEFDTLSTDLLSATDIAEAKDIVDQLQAFLADDLPYVTLFTTPIFDPYNSDRIEFPYTSILGGITIVNGLIASARPKGGPSLTITEVTTGLPNATATALTSVIMRVTVESAEDVAGIQFEVLYDGQTVTVPENGVARRSPPGFLFRSNIDNAKGRVSVATAASQGSGQSSLIVAEITFLPTVGPGECTDLTLAEIVAVNESVPPEFISVAPVHGSICVEGAEGVDAPVELRPA